ncbi:hypothetical protein [Piscirickettsia litoralis]|uniref:Uncharacterized protein n=1 Tax=Piscirickettsia litoralis TaxID=1891921 RepID=A0ABX3A1Y2_9GAMM|nr:hypothetical protein [Piscirickettsia litoralis]ODN42453.1 hypothetical protein BGC07_05295 [Piscirickettsia litoralis]
MIISAKEVSQFKKELRESGVDLPKEVEKFLDNIKDVRVTKDMLVLGSKLSGSRMTYDTVRALEEMEGNEYPTVEIMLRKLIDKKQSSEGVELCFEENIGIKEYNYTLAAFPNDELKEVVRLNKDVNKERGAIFYRLSNSKRAKEDHLAFKLNSMSIAYEKLPGVTQNRLRDSFNQQGLRLRYLDEKTGIGKSVDFEDKKHVRGKVTKRLTKLWSKHEFTPNSKKQEGNCNVSSSSLAESASYGAFFGTVKGQSVKNGSIFGYGHNQRIQLWNPLRNLMQTKKNRCFNKLFSS